MIEDKEDCCDNCEEGIEPCCDEQLADHIDAIFAEVEEEKQDEPEQHDPFIPEEKAKDRLAEQLAKHLCCQTKFYIITKAMQGMKATQLKKLRDDLRKFTPKNQLHPMLESKFRNAIAAVE